MKLPITYNFEPHYKGDGLAPLRLYFTDGDNEPIDLSFSTALMQLRVPSYSKPGKVVWEFSSEATDADKLLILTYDGYVYFPEMDIWDLISNEYVYDLQITDGNGFVKTFTKGILPVNQDVSYKTI